MVAVLTAVSGVVFWFTRENDRPVEYTYAVVEEGDIESVVVASGALEAWNTVVVGSQLSGQILELHADFNDVVAQGDLLARLDPRTFESRLNQAKANVETAEAGIQSRKAELLRARREFSQAQRDIDRTTLLKEEGHVSDAMLESGRVALENAETQVAIAQANLVNAEATLTQRKASLEQAELDLERTDIRSPIAGTVINRNVELGQTVAASLQAPELYSIANDLRRMKVEASVDEADIGRIAEGLECRFSVDAFPNRQFVGSVQQVRKAPAVQSNVVTYKVIITARNRDLSLLPGMTANVEIVLGRKHGVLKVPNAALRFVPKGETALVPQAERQSEERRGRRPGRGLEQFERLKGELGLTVAQERAWALAIEESSTRMRTMFESVRQEQQGGLSDRSGMRERMSLVRDELGTSLRNLLESDEQRSLFDETFGLSRSATTRGRVWVHELGELISKPLVIGLQDDSFTEAIGGIEAGQEVIVRARLRVPE